MEASHTISEIVQCAKDLCESIRTTRHHIRDDTQRELDTILLTSIAIYRRNRNSHCPVNRLPPEILGYIFELRHNTFLYDEEKLGNAVGSFTLSHVCHHWREVALGNPHLWSSIDEKWCDTAQEAMFDRSGTTGLRIRMRSAEGALTQALGPRIRELHWIAFGDNDLENLQFPAEKLESLRIEGITHDSDFHFPTLFNGHVPRLRRLSLRNVVWFPSNPLLGLTHLSLTKGAIPSPISSLLEILSTCTSLTNLSLKDSLYERYPRLDYDGPVVSLPNLRSLELVLSGDNTTTLLSHIALLASTTVCVRLNDLNVDMAQRLSSISAAQGVTKLLVFFGEGSIDITAASASSTSGIRVSILRNNRNPFFTSTLPNLLPMRQIRELWVYEESTAIHGWDIRIILQELPALKVLRLPAPYINMLCGLVRSPANLNQEELPHCPELCVLHIRSLRYSHRPGIVNLLKNVESSWRQSSTGARAQLEYVTIDRLLRDLLPGDGKHSTDFDDLRLSLRIKEFRFKKAPRIELPLAVMNLLDRDKCFRQVFD